MEIIFHSRNTQRAEDFDPIVIDKLNTLSRFGVTIDSIKVEVTEESNPHFGKSSHQVHLTTHGSGPFFRAEGSGFNNLSAFDVAVKSLELQLRKVHEKNKSVDHDKIAANLEAL
jgi:ribosomal subunit interface protein